jgi:uncharacterized membrane protein (GlpM family)
VANGHKRCGVQIVFRFVIGGLMVSLFALIGDLIKPKSFAGIFGAAPSVALATLALTIASKGHQYAADELRATICGAAAFFVYASTVSWLIMRYRLTAFTVTMTLIPLWLVIAFGGWFVFLK